MSWWQILFYPFAILYDLVTRIRNYLFDKKVFYSFKFNAEVIGVGNLAVGGTGKTPMTDYLIKYFLSKERKPATLSRGYGRRTSGFMEVTTEDDSKTAGDEQVMIKSKYGENVRTFVGENRLESIPEILGKFDESPIVILDDSFQHRSVVPSLSILLTTYDNPFTSDFVLPSGFLREGRNGAGRADIIVVTKCPNNVTYSQKRELKESIASFNNKAKIYFSSHVLKKPVPLFKDREITKKVVAVAAIAKPEQFFESLKDFEITSNLAFDDHYEYKSSDVKWMIKLLDKGNISLVCTSKDAVKLRKYPELDKYPCFEIPTEIEFLEDEKEFQDELDRLLKVSNN